MSETEISEAQAERIRLLLADDHAVVRSGTRELLERQPDFHIVGEAVDGEEAVKLTDELQPDVVVMDVRMPKMDGVTAQQTIREESGHKLPIIAMTAQAMKGDREKCLAVGMDHYLTKPIRRRELQGLIKQLVG